MENLVPLHRLVRLCWLAFLVFSMGELSGLPVPVKLVVASSVKITLEFQIATHLFKEIQ